MNPLDYIKMYSRAILAVLALAIVVAVSVTIFTLKKQRDNARTALATAQQVIKDYTRESEAAKARTASLVELAASNEVANADDLKKLREQVATSDEEAKRLAIEAGKIIGGLK